MVAYMKDFKKITGKNIIYKKKFNNQIIIYLNDF
jgi:hypothetical protein